MRFVAVKDGFVPVQVVFEVLCDFRESGQSRKSDAISPRSVRQPIRGRVRYLLASLGASRNEVAPFFGVDQTIVCHDSGKQAKTA